MMTKRERIRFKRPAEFQVGDIISRGDWRLDDSPHVEFRHLRLTHVVMIVSIEPALIEGKRWGYCIPVLGSYKISPEFKAARLSEGRSNLSYRFEDRLFFPCLTS